MKHTIWSSDIGDLKEWAGCVEDWDDLTLEEQTREAEELNADYFEDEKLNLDVPAGTVVVFADLGLWDGRHGGYKIIENASLADCLDGFIDSDWRGSFYVEDGDFKARIAHHDGCNFLTFRAVISGNEDAFNEARWVNDQDKMYKLTESLAPAVSNVYGWRD